MAYNPLPPLGQDDMAGSLPVVIASDQSAVPVTVSGVATAANQTTIIGHVDGIETLIGTTNTTLGTIDTDTGNISTKIDTLAGAVAGTEVQVDVLTMPTVTVTATNLDVQSGGADLATTTQAGAIQTAVELIDDTVVADDAAFTPATTKVQMMGFTFDDVAPDSVNEGDAGAARMSANRNIYTTVRDAAGNERGQNVDANGNAGVVLAAETTKVIGTVRVASGGIASGAIASGAIASGAIAAGAIAAGATSIADNEDVASAAGDRLVKVAQIRLDTPVSGANASNSGDYTQFIADSFGKTWTADNQSEDAAHTSGDRGSFALGVRTDVPNAVGAGTTGDYSFLATDMAGGIRTALYETDFAVLGTNHVKKYYTNSGAVTDGIVWSPAAGKRWYVTDIFINTSAAATITLEDDLAGGDSPVWKAELAANSGWSHHFGTPLFSGEDAADLIITTSAGNVYVTVTGYEI